MVSHISQAGAVTTGPGRGVSEAHENGGHVQKKGRGLVLRGLGDQSGVGLLEH